MSSLQRALHLWRARDLDGALRECVRLLAATPGDTAALNLSAEVHAARGESAEALGCLERVAQLQPRDAAAHRRLGDARFERGDITQAITSFRAAIALEPSNLRAHNNLGRALARVGDSVGAEASYQSALALDPRYAIAHLNLGILLAAKNEAPRAFEHVAKAASLRPEMPDAWTHCAALLLRLNRPADALVCCDRALAIDPRLADVHYTRGGALRDLKRFEEAEACCERALALRPDFAEAHYARAKMRRDAGDWRGAIAGFEDAIHAKPDYHAARMARAIASVPAMPKDVAEIKASREAFANDLKALEDWLRNNPCQDAPVMVGATQPFFLAYQACENLDLLRVHGRICAKAMSDWQDARGLPTGAARRLGRTRPRIGIVSAQIRGHSVFRALIRGWLKLLDRRYLEIHIFYLGAQTDQHTQFARAHADHFEQGIQPLEDWVRSIEAQEIDALIYPEVGMDQLTLQLASMRLAPVQMVAWGHPETSGLSTMDYYLSAQAFESAESARYYSEQLICMPNLGSHYEPSDLAPGNAELTRFSIDRTVPSLICAGTPFKYAPEHDRVFVDIAARLGRCEFHFFEYENKALSRRLIERITAQFEAAGLAAGRFIRLQPWANPGEFQALLSSATLQLDTIGFSGFNTVIKALECDLPVVTQEGQFMRGRFGSGILQRLGITELVARDDAAYVDIVVNLVEKGELRDQIRERIRTRRDILFRDSETVAGLQQFLLDLTAAN